MSLNEKLLFSKEDLLFESRLNGTNNKGSYSTMQFVLRLRDDVRNALTKEEYDYESIQAHSTNIHENIHWWQHMGSNIGLLLSLTYPAFTSMSSESLKKLIDNQIAFKSIIKYDEQYYKTFRKADIEDINLTLNNYYDLEYAKRFLLSNPSIHEIKKDMRFFLHIGHCFHVFWSQTISSIASAVDENFSFLPKINNWVGEFKKLTDNKTEGFYEETSMHISSIGIWAIYEGQAIFNQMQYLTVALNRDLIYSDFEDIGMLHGIYIEAFEHFLEFTGYNKPTNLLDPIVGLFLLVCDISINPTNGFPFDIYDYENFINKNDPGLRFTILSKIIGGNPDEYLNKLKNYSKPEYIELCDSLCNSAGYASSYLGIQQVIEWFKIESINQLLQQESQHKFPDPNMPMRLIFSKFLRFQEDKFIHPNLFCWFGYHAVPDNGNLDMKTVNEMFKKHHALFIDDYDNEVKPVISDKLNQDDIQETFNTFYEYVLLYDLILQWIEEEGDFKYNYEWLLNNGDEMIPIVKENFKNLFGIFPDKIQVIE